MIKILERPRQGRAASSRRNVRLTAKCSHCGGGGHVRRKRCNVCFGIGYTLTEARLKAARETDARFYELLSS